MNLHHQEICFIAIFNFPDVESVASHSPGRIRLALSPPVAAITESIQ